MVNLLTPNFLDCLSSTLTQSQCQLLGKSKTALLPVVEKLRIIFLG